MKKIKGNFTDLLDALLDDVLKYTLENDVKIAKQHLNENCNDFKLKGFNSYIKNTYDGYTSFFNTMKIHREGFFNMCYLYIEGHKDFEGLKLTEYGKLHRCAITKADA